MGSNLQSVDGVVEEIMRIHKSLPTRPSLDEVEAARALIQNVEKEEEARLDGISKQKKSQQVSEELFFVLTEMQRNLVFFQSKEQKRDAFKVLDLENVYVMFDQFVQRASQCLSSVSTSAGGNNYSKTSVSSNFSTTTLTPAVTGLGPSSSTNYSDKISADKISARSFDKFSRDDSYVNKGKSNFHVDGFGVAAIAPSQPKIVDLSLKPPSQESEKLSLIKLASLIEVSVKKGTRELNLQQKLMDQIDWLPDSIGKLSSLITLDLSENRIIVLPTTIGGLSSLTKLDLHSNRIAELPESLGNLLSLLSLDLRGNQLTSLPASFGKLSRLQELDLSSNRLAVLPDSIGTLFSLQKLNVETNDIEEIPHTIGQCSNLSELRADYNKLKALPEAVGRLASLEILTVRYNNIKQLPTTMSHMSKLREIDVSFNELESVPDTIGLVTTLVKMNVGNNFADLKSLPRSIGNLEMLEELDISNNQIHVLPESFRMLSRLRVLRVDQNPLELPPRDIAEQGAKAVVQYMEELVSKRNVVSQPAKQKTTWYRLCFFSKSNRSKYNGIAVKV